MNDASQKALHVLNLPDETFYNLTADQQEAIDSQLAPAMDTDLPPEPIWAIAAPKVLEVRPGMAVPIILAKRYTGLRRWEVRPFPNMAWIITDLTSGAVHTVVPLTLDKRRMRTPPPSRMPPAPNPVDAASVTAGIEMQGLPPVFGTMWPSERYAATLTYYDWVSNTIVLERKPKLEPRPQRTALATPLVRVEQNRPVETEGVTLALDAAGSPADPILSGTVLVSEDRAVLLHSPAVDGATVLALSISFIRLDSTAPDQIDLMLPVQPASHRISARFRFHVRDIWKGAEFAGTYQVYATTGQVVSGPYPLEFSN